jgi:hypothetical protein
VSAAGRIDMLAVYAVESLLQRRFLRRSARAADDGPSMLGATGGDRYGQAELGVRGPGGIKTETDRGCRRSSGPYRCNVFVDRERRFATWVSNTVANAQTGKAAPVRQRSRNAQRRGGNERSSEG